MRRGAWLLVGMIIAAWVVTACGSDSKKSDPTPEPSATPAATSAEFSPGGTGLSLGTGSDLAPTPATGALSSGMPGCSDPNSDECPTPLTLDLDAAASAGGASLSYPSRYFDAATADSGTLITITPSERNKFEDRATFEVYFADSVDAALSVLTDPDTAPWTVGDWQGTIGVSKDTTQDPPVNTTIGAFALADGRAIVLKATTTGQYGWDLWALVYESMLNTLAVSG
jgi:hypothetical protein